MTSLPPVPDCEGPQLRPYQSSGTPEIVFLEEIGQGAHGHVFKVKIAGSTYALKVFNHQLIGPEFLTANEDDWPKIDVKLLTEQWHPFNAECRAYGRLKETMNEHLAARCYGYLCLTEDQKKELEDRFGISAWWDDDYDLETTDDDCQQEFEEEGRRPLRAIVKEFMHSDVPFDPEHAPMMISDLVQLHRLGIAIHDLKEDAYVGGKLVDFSKAVVVPHIMYSHRLRGNADETARGEVYEDLARLLTRFHDWNEEHEGCPPIKADPFSTLDDAIGRLRRGPLTWKEYTARCLNPRKIRWQKFNPRRGRGSSVATQSATARKSGDMGKRTSGVSKQRKTTAKNRKVRK